MRLTVFVLALHFCLAGVTHARDLTVALGVQDAKAATAAFEIGKGFAQSGGLAAFNEALAREICRRIAARCTLTHVVFANILPGVEAGNFDLGFGNFLRTAEREKRVGFSASIWRSSSRLVATTRVAEQLAIRLQGEVTLDTLQGVRLAVIEGTQQDAYLRNIPAERRLTVVAYKTMAEILPALQDGTADISLLPMMSTYAMISREPPGRFTFVGPAVVDRGLGGSVHIILPKQKEDVLQQVDQAIVALRADGTYQRIARQFFPFSPD